LLILFANLSNALSTDYSTFPVLKLIFKLSKLYKLANKSSNAFLASGVKFSNASILDWIKSSIF